MEARPTTRPLSKDCVFCTANSISVVENVEKEPSLSDPLASRHPVRFPTCLNRAHTGDRSTEILSQGLVWLRLDHASVCYFLTQRPSQGNPLLTDKTTD
jgi:hypothetical protein